MENPEPDLPTGKEVRGIIAAPKMLENLKDLLGPLNTEVIEAYSFADAHFQLGQKNAERINTALTEWLNELKPKKVKEIIEISKQIHRHMLNKAAELETSNPKISSAIHEYIASLEAWSRGAGLENSPMAKQLGASGYELALLLQNDSVGCQTIMIRGEKGQLIFGHSEEDDEPRRVRHNNWTQFKINQNQQIQTRTAYTSYVDLLPGPAFCLTPNGIMASDSTFVDTPDKIGFLGNTVSWILWRMGAEKNAQDIVSKLLPSPSGYALNLAYADNDQGKIVGKVIEYAGNEISVTEVGDEPGDHSIHTNAIHNTNPALKDLEKLGARDSNLFSGRIATLTTILNAIKNRPDHSFPNPIESLKKIFGFRGSKPGQWRYQDAHIRPHVLHKITKYQGIASGWSRALIFAEVSLGKPIAYQIESGPVLKGKVFDEKT